LALPFYIYCDEPADSLYQLQDGRFQLIAGGPIAPFMVGSDYVLIEEALANFLLVRGLDDIRFAPAIIYRRSTGEEYRTHEQITVRQRFDQRTIRDLALDGDRLLLMNNRYLFVSPTLKIALEDSGFRYLRFSEGLSEFAASI
jgi:hypothetical protein